MSYTCPTCGRTSQNPHDEANKYCGHCHVFEDDIATRRHMEEWGSGAFTDRGEEREERE